MLHAHPFARATPRVGRTIIGVFGPSCSRWTMCAVRATSRRRRWVALVLRGRARPHRPGGVCPSSARRALVRLFHACLLRVHGPMGRCEFVADTFAVTATSFAYGRCDTSRSSAWTRPCRGSCQVGADPAGRPTSPTCRRHRVLVMIEQVSDVMSSRCRRRWSVSPWPLPSLSSGAPRPGSAAWYAAHRRGDRRRRAPRRQAGPPGACSTAPASASRMTRSMLPPASLTRSASDQPRSASAARSRG